MTTKKDGYLGNPNLKPVGVQQQFTPDQVQEYIKCANDPVYFVEKYVKIVAVDKGLVPFEMYDFQKELIGKLHGNRFVIGKLPRQVGKTTTVGAYLLHYVLFNQNMNVAILANKQSTFPFCLIMSGAAAAYGGRAKQYHPAEAGGQQPGRFREGSPCFQHDPGGRARHMQPGRTRHCLPHRVV